MDSTHLHQQEEIRAITPLLSPPVNKPQEYRLKVIQWRDPQTQRLREAKIVTQNENGPCPLIALVNVLTLTTSSGFTIGGSPNKRTTTDEELVSLLANHLLQRTEPPPDSSNETGHSVPAEHDVNAVLSLLPTLSKGLDVDLQFSHIYDFGVTPASLLFRAFAVDLVHGWVVDPKEEQEVAAILLRDCRNSYEGAVEFIFAADVLCGGKVVGRSKMADGTQTGSVADALRLSEWMDMNATQLTDCGLHGLGTLLPPNHLCVLFRNNHFSTLFRRSTGELYILCTDDVVASDERIVWETLSDVRQASSRFLDSQFQPLSKQIVAGSREQTEDYVCEKEGSEQIDEDYALALRLNDEEQRGGERRLQVRQQDRLPPGMVVKEHGQLYGVPVVTREGETQLARAIYRSASDENFSRRMTDAFLPHEAAKAKQHKKEEKCIIC
ncbi:hypothetical protein GGI20_002157 [Coemansia sp. BCRC 34301]|nr:hypothetical protein GGI20_002157 [Coemansia sp. BCRC 34301]